MNVYRDIPRCRTCGPGTITYRKGDYVCVKCGRPGWISERLLGLRSRTRPNAGSSGAWALAPPGKKDAPFLLV